MKDLLTGEQMLSTERQNFGRVQKLSHFGVRKISRISYKKDTKIEFSDVLRIFELILHLESNLAEILKIPFAPRAKNLEHFLKIVQSR